MQQVILSSLEDQTWDGIEEERSQALQKIERQKRLIKKLGREAQEHTDDKTAELQTHNITLITA
ncbi:transposase-like protein [Metarhizium robertsii ARSEF 23]|uniref:Transposase-like protein n=1 Tax=Metarhizium robertsii (strain ARSEF 23 / ATCC MYA-3075) TaxID=655844 RepID=E9EJ38_METRA|nr:transposase-like protein [Metarhizium robertsii ARSEF 23]EFZ03315.2 transposase-like protein [Metarhizium robertsii ARSEF 23]